jgi:hypothetical protein
MESVKVPSPSRWAGVVPFYEFVQGTSPGAEAGFVKISESLL